MLDSSVSKAVGSFQLLLHKRKLVGVHAENGIFHVRARTSDHQNALNTMVRTLSKEHRHDVVIELAPLKGRSGFTHKVTFSRKPI